jgi:hypothetical protein
LFATRDNYFGHTIGLLLNQTPQFLKQQRLFWAIYAQCNAILLQLAIVTRPTLYTSTEHTKRAEYAISI